MRFAFDDEALAFRDAVRDLLAKECPPEVVRSAWPDDDRGAGARADAGSVAALWARLGEMGVLGVAVADPHGLGLDELGWVLLAEEAGYAGVPGPFTETVAVAGPLLAAAGDPGGHVAGLVEGTVTAAALFDDASRLLAHGRTADIALVARDGGVVLLTRDELGGEPVESFDGSRHLVRIDVDAAARSGRRVTDDPVVVARAAHRGALGAAAELVGLSRRMLDLTVGYVVERRQFGQPIGAFQAVKHHLADALMHLELARPAVYRAAWSLSVDADTADRDVSMAKAMASDAAALVGAAALQCHGAIGYTVEYDLHLYLKRARALGGAWGTAGWHRDRVGRAIGV